MVEVVSEEELAGADRLPHVLRDAAPLLAAMSLLMAGSGFTATLLGVRAGLEGFGPGVTGLILSAFYVGFLAGSLITSRTIWRVGHIRVFAALASLLSAAVLVHAVRPMPGTWLGLRLVAGVCLAGLYIVTETWLNGAATNTTRGGLLAFYTVAVTASQAAGQLMLPVADPRGFSAFILASVMVSLAVLPVSLATVSPPPVFDVTRLRLRELWAIAPLAPVAALVSGFATAALIGGTGAVFAAMVGLTRGQTSALLFAVLVGALLMQFPLGRWSDTVDRRRVIVVTSVLGAVGTGAAATMTDRIGVLVVLTSVVGGSAFVLYSLANAHLHDHLHDDRVIGGGAAMVLVFGMGAVAGPVVASSGMDLFGPEALFLLIGASYLLAAGFAVWRIMVRPPVPEEDRAPYSAVPVGTGPTAATLADASPEALHPFPVEERTASGPEGDVTYRIQGAGNPVVLLGTTPTTEAWDALLGALAADGVLAVGVDHVPTVREDEGPRAALLAVLRDLGLGSSTFVGLDGGAVHVAELVAEHSDRTDGVVFAGPALPVTSDQTELEGRSLLVLTEDAGAPYWDDPERFADGVVEFVRQLPPQSAEVWGTGST